MNAQPTKQHEWLCKLLGEWTLVETSTDLAKPPQHGKWTERVRSLGGLWVVAEGQGEMPGGGGAATTIMTLGYDPQKQRYVGTWVGSMMTYLWVYDGSLDAAGTTLTLDCEGPSMTGDGRMTRYKDVIEFKSDDHRVLRASSLGEDGTWTTFMTSRFRRTT